MIIQSKKVWLADQFVPAALELEQGRITGIFPYGEKLSWRTRRLARYRRNVPVCLLCCAPKAAFFVKEQ